MVDVAKVIPGDHASILKIYSHVRSHFRAYAPLDRRMRDPAAGRLLRRRYRAELEAAIAEGTVSSNEIDDCQPSRPLS